MAAAPPLASFDVFQTQTEAACNTLADKLGKDVCMYTGLKVPTSEQVKLVLLTPKGTPRVVKLSCFCNAEALHLFVKDLGKGLYESESKRLLLVNGVSKVANKERYNTVRQVATARGKCSPFLSADELKSLEDERAAFVVAEKAKIDAALEKAKAETLVAKEKAKAEVAAAKADAKAAKAQHIPSNGEPIDLLPGASPKRAPKRKSVDAAPQPEGMSYEGTGVVFGEEAVVVDTVIEASSPKPKAKRVKKEKAPAKLPEILGVAPDESLSASAQWSGMAL